MSPTESPRNHLPVTGSLTLAYALSLALALIMSGASIAGLAYRTSLYPDDLPAFPIQDGVNLAVGLPLLLGSMWLARRGKLIGLLSWPGMLVYVLYGYVTYLLVVPFNALFLAYLSLVTLSAYTLIGLVAGIDGEAVRQRLDGVAPARSGGAILVILGLISAVRVIVLAVGAAIAGTPVEMVESGVWIADFVVQCPMLLAGGLLLWQRKPLGYVCGAGLLLQYAVLALSVVPILLAEPRTSGTPVDVAGVAVLLVMTVVCLAPLAGFVRGASGRGSPPA